MSSEKTKQLYDLPKLVFTRWNLFLKNLQKEIQIVMEFYKGIWCVYFMKWKYMKILPKKNQKNHEEKKNQKNKNQNEKMKKKKT